MSRFSTSWSSSIYSIIFSLILILLFFCLQIKAFVGYIDIKLSYFQVVMAGSEIIFNFLKILLIYTTQIFYQERMVYVFNNGILLIKEISQLLDDGDQFVDKKCLKQIGNRGVTLIIQAFSVVSIFSVTFFIHSQYEVWFLTGYIHISTVLITGTIYFSGMIAIGRLYRILYLTLKSLFRPVKNIQVSNDLIVSERIDRIASYYQKVTIFTKNFNSLFGIHITISLMSCYVNILNSVSYCISKDCDYYMIHELLTILAGILCIYCYKGKFFQLCTESVNIN